ncbi:MAG: zf-HC2 domain-containing protein [Clostridia bacterium]|nr:zf-HC2 domain-containing protein [Clostridia bacterium]
MSKAVCTQCGVVGDLLPLYIDKCCSEESRSIVESHLKECEDCKSVFDSMCCENAGDKQEFEVPHKLKRVNDWKASVLQSVLLFVSFGILAVSITMEAYTPYGITNGLWAFAAIVPTAGFMLSLSNWYFIRAYKSRRAFSDFSSIFTFIISAVCYVWAVVHYNSTFFNLSGSLFKFLAIGVAVTAVFCMVSKVASNIYAKLLGKE